MLYAVLPSMNSNGRRAPQAYPWGRETIVVHDRATHAIYGRHVAPLSLKAVLSGRESYNVHGFDETVAPGEWLVINDGEAYESAIDATVAVETLCVFFSGADAEEAGRAALADGKLLDDPEARGEALTFASIKRRTGRTLAQALARLPSLRAAPSLERQQFALDLLALIRAGEQPHRRRAARIEAVRASTRQELYRRCLVSRAYLETAYAEDLTLPDLSRFAGMSRAHFLRAFRCCFGETPAAALRRVRLERAASLLGRGSSSVTEVALAVGYENFSAFARAFRRRYGVSPSSARG